MENRKFGSLSSSVDPQKLSATVSGAILLFSGLLISLGSWLGIPLTDSQIGVFAQQVGVGAGALWFLYGVVRKTIVAVQQKFA